MTLGEFQEFCLGLKGVSEEFPFGEDTLVYKVMGKMFALTDLTNFESINLKVDPELGAELRETWAAVTPGYHMNKKHWITVLNDGTVPNKILKSWILGSYELVVSKLPRKDKTLLDRL